MEDQKGRAARTQSGANFPPARYAVSVGTPALPKACRTSWLLGRAVLVRKFIAWPIASAFPSLQHYHNFLASPSHPRHRTGIRPGAANLARVHRSRLHVPQRHAENALLRQCMRKILPLVASDGLTVVLRTRHAHSVSGTETVQGCRRRLPELA